MPRFILSLTRDTSQNGLVEIEADTPEDAEALFEKGEYDKNGVKWEDGDWLSDPDLIEILTPDDFDETGKVIRSVGTVPHDATAASVGEEA
jgi:hypothetical protein